MSEITAPDDLQTEDRIPYLPSPEEIRLGCLAIQATWSAAEEMSRRVFRPETTETRTVRGMTD